MRTRGHPGRRRGQLAALIVLLLALGAPLGTTGRAGATEPDPDLRTALARAGVLLDWYERSDVSVRLSMLPVSGNGSEAARDSVVHIADQLVEHRAEARYVAATLRVQLDRVESMSRQIARLDERIGADQRELDTVRLALQQQAVTRYILGETAVAPLPTSVSIATGEQARAVTLAAVTEDLLARKRDLEARLGDLRVRRSETVESRSASQAQADDLTARIGELTAAVAALERALPDAIDAAHAARRLATVNGLGLPLVVLDAYVRAADHQQAEAPWCAVRWQILAGIAAVESEHGTFQRNVVLASGRTSGAILGPVLDGTLEGTVVVTDTDRGALDGNASFDRAVGPFQFLPGTWRSFARDGNGDGIADPHNMYDAARAAAAYLCHHGGVGSPGQADRAIRAYNDSGAYVRAVLGYAARYDAFAVPALPTPS